MNTRIRKATLNDAEAFMAIKDQLPISMADGTTTKGGFLLGTDIDTYRQFIENEYCLVAEVDTQVVGFGIILKDFTLRASEIWEKRTSADWFINLADYEWQQLAYFEQLAFLKGHKKAVLILCYNLMKWVFEQGYETLFTTTVNKPILNLAAIPFIEAAGGIHAGNIDEFYPKIGQINSDIYLIERKIFSVKVKSLPLFPFFEANTFKFN